MQAFIPKLKDHVLYRLRNLDISYCDHTFTDAERNSVIISDNRIFSVQTMQVCYVHYQFRWCMMLPFDRFITRPTTFSESMTRSILVRMLMSWSCLGKQGPDIHIGMPVFWAFTTWMYGSIPEVQLKGARLRFSMSDGWHP
jgi:hypothetical protein